MFYLPIFPYLNIFYRRLLRQPRVLYFVFIAMSILKYFHKTKRKDQEDNVEIKFPDPDGDLSKTVPSKAIRAANESIEQLLKPKLKGVRKTPYLV